MTALPLPRAVSVGSSRGGRGDTAPNRHCHTRRLRTGFLAPLRLCFLPRFWMFQTDTGRQRLPRAAPEPRPWRWIPAVAAACPCPHPPLRRCARWLRSPPLRRTRGRQPPRTKVNAAGGGQRGRCCKPRGAAAAPSALAGPRRRGLRCRRSAALDPWSRGGGRELGATRVRCRSFGGLCLRPRGPGGASLGRVAERCWILLKLSQSVVSFPASRGRLVTGPGLRCFSPAQPQLRVQTGTPRGMREGSGLRRSFVSKGAVGSRERV